MVRDPSGALATSDISNPTKRPSAYLIGMAARTYSVFITGGTGYIGTPLMRSLVERGHKVRALVRRDGKEASARSGSGPRQCAGCIFLRSADSAFAYLCAIGRSLSSQPSESCGVPGH